MLTVTRLPLRLEPDPRRVVARPFVPGTPNFGGPPDRLARIVGRVLDLPPTDRERMLAGARHTAGGKHRNPEAAWLRHHAIAAARSPQAAAVTSPADRLLLGAYLTQEFAYEAAALTNPSIVARGEPDGEGRQRFVLSMRAIGEGHVSSIAFASGAVGPDGAVTLDARSPFATNGARHTPTYDAAEFGARLAELGADNEVTAAVLDEVGPAFDRAELEVALRHVADRGLGGVAVEETLKRIRWLAASNYVVDFDGAELSERLISPAGPAESAGMEDARFVRFVDDDGRTTYYATYTAFDGSRILPQLIRTDDFVRFRVATLRGPMAANKGLALFPRRIGGLYTALSRHDQERNYVLRSDSVRDWRNAELAFGPVEGWEAVQGGNGGSPIELAEGWLVVTHGVGPMRRYALGAVLLDLDEPTKVLARLREPLLEPEGDEGVGYVPNVVYTCGAMVHAGRLVLPYGVADRGIRFATVPVSDLLAAMD